MTRATLLWGGARNGMPEPGGYVYRGSKRLDDSNSYLCEGGCGRRLENRPGPRMGSCAVCREAGGLDLERPSGKRVGPKFRNGL